MGPSHCARCVEGACSRGASCLQASLGIELAVDKTADQLNADDDFKDALAESIADICDFASKGLSASNIKDLTISGGAEVRRLDVGADGSESGGRALQTSYSFEISYTISYDPAEVTIDVVELEEAVMQAQQDAIDGGNFATALDTYMPAQYVGAVTVTVVSVTILATSAPTFWSDTDEAEPTPEVIIRRLGGHSDLPACGCDE